MKKFDNKVKLAKIRNKRVHIIFIIVIIILILISLYMSKNESIICYILAGFIGILEIIYLFINKNGKLINNSIIVLEQRGILEDVKEDYENSELKKFKTIKLELTDKYIYSFADSIIIVPYEDITRVYHSNVINSKYQTKMYIALETVDCLRYFIAEKPLGSKNAEFDEALEYIKEKINSGGHSI